MWGNEIKSERANSARTFPAGASSRLTRESSEGRSSLSFLVRDEVGLAHSLAKAIPNSQSESKTMFYKNGSWDSGAEWENSRHFNECLLELVKSNNIDPEMAIGESVVDGSRVVEIKPWAEETAMEIWDSSTRFYHFIAHIASMDEHQKISIHDLEPFMADQAVNIRDKFYGKAKRARELVFLAGIDDFVQSADRVSARELLEAIAVGYEYFGDE